MLRLDSESSPELVAPKVWPSARMRRRSDLGVVSAGIVMLIGFWVIPWVTVQAETAGNSVLDAAIRADFSGPGKPLNRRILGVGFIRPPFDRAFVDFWGDGIFDGTSARIWVTPNKAGDVPKSKLADSQAAINYACELDIEERIGFAAGVVKIRRRARYDSESDNNLDPVHQPHSVAGIVEQLSPPNPEEGCGLTGWEVWNEPQFRKKGEWPAEDLALYAVDVARAIHTIRPQIRVGVPLHERDMDWNRRLLQELVRIAPNEIDFVSFHPYWIAWWKEADDVGLDFSRAAGAEVLREISIRPKVDLVRQVGNGRWSLVASEWNVHPKGYRPPYDISTDMSAALHLAGMMDVYIGEGVDSAQFFLLRNPQYGHFGLSYQDGDGHWYNATGLAMRLYGRYLRGATVDTVVTTPTRTYPVPVGGLVEVPAIFGTIAHDPDANRLAIFIGNRDSEHAGQVRLELTGLVGDWWDVEEYRLSRSDSSRETTVSHRELTPWRQADVVEGIQVLVPPMSLVVLVATRPNGADDAQAISYVKSDIEERMRWTRNVH